MKLETMKNKLIISFDNENLDFKNIDTLVQNIRNFDKEKITICVLDFSKLLDIDTKAICYITDLVREFDLQFFIVCNELNKKVNVKINLTGLKSIISTFNNFNELEEFIKNQKFEF